MKVSVCMVTYNHERFIEQAVTSALMQETNFQYEIVVGEDCSTDRTRDILLELQHRHPTRIRLLLQEQNIGGQQNFVQTLQACEGHYVAYLEGDDYWISRDKLQKQVDFLDAHPDFAICFHNALKIYEDNSQPPINVCPDTLPAISTIEDIIRTNFIPACSVMFRRNLFGAFPDWYYGLKVGDWPLHILNAQYGQIGYIDEVLSTYRVHGAAIWSTLRSSQVTEYAAEMLRQIDAQLDFKYHNAVDQAISQLYDHWAWDIITNQLPREGRQAIFQTANQLDPETCAHLLTAIATRATVLDRGKAWLDEQRLNLHAEAERRAQQLAEQQRWVEQLEQGKAWLTQQQASWQIEVGNLTRLLAEQQQWVEQLEQGKAWLDQDRGNWQAEAERLTQELARLQNEYAQLEQRHDQLVEQDRVLKEQRLSRRLYRAGVRVRKLIGTAGSGTTNDT